MIKKDESRLSSAKESNTSDLIKSLISLGSLQTRVFLSTGRRFLEANTGNACPFFSKVVL